MNARPATDAADAADAGGTSLRGHDLAFTKRLTIYAAAVVISLVAWILNVQQLYWMAGIMFLLPQASRVFGLLEHAGLDIQRVHPGAGHQGEWMPVRWRVENLRRFPKLQLSLSDALPTGLQADPPEPMPVHLMPYAQDETEYRLRLGRRGVHTLREVRVTSTDVLGLYRLESRVPQETQIVVYPRVVELPARLMPSETGGGDVPLTASRRQGEGPGFYGIREYRPGDPLRHVHWRTAARLGRLAVVEWEAEESVDALIALETQRGSEQEWIGGSNLDAAVGLAASLAATILAVGDSVRLLAPGTTEWKPTAERGMDALPALLEILARVQAVSETSVAAELRNAAAHVVPGTLVCWLATMPDGSLVETARYLRAVHLRPVIYALTHPSQPKWSETRMELERIGVPVITVTPEDEVVVRLLQ